MEKARSKAGKNERENNEQIFTARWMQKSVTSLYSMGNLMTCSG
jgi:hypothetical protein